ncbi:hypothetical protein CALCODRAFT_556451 [Calocera cornea HHB12733]|uniref:Uncharacterized protein n=1 Tax=Calocera cornea HHB12733 TaxID=1353952 RepID=A0A165ES83_9BASI|nr:hypothetical protein CALCODRAFT_556451 [Calocera cornea HHB12733]
MTTLPPVSVSYAPGAFPHAHAHPRSSNLSNSHSSYSHSSHNHPPIPTTISTVTAGSGSGSGSGGGKQAGWWRRPSQSQSSPPAQLAHSQSQSQIRSRPSVSQLQSQYQSQSQAQPSGTKANAAQSRSAATSTAASSASSLSAASPSSPVDPLHYYTTTTTTSSVSASAAGSGSPSTRSPRDEGRATFGPSSGRALERMRAEAGDAAGALEPRAGGTAGGGGGFSIASLRSVFKPKKRPALDLQPPPQQQHQQAHTQTQARPHTSHHLSHTSRTSTGTGTGTTSSFYTAPRPPHSALSSPTSPPPSGSGPLARTTSYVVPDFERQRARAYTASYGGAGAQQRPPPRSRSFTVAEPVRHPGLPRSTTVPSLSASAALARAEADRDRDRDRDRGRPERPTREGVHEDMRFLRELTELVDRETREGFGALGELEEREEQEEAGEEEEDWDGEGEGTRRQRDPAKTRPSISTASAYSDVPSHITEAHERPSTDTTDTTGTTGTEGTGPSSRDSQPLLPDAALAEVVQRTSEPSPELRRLQAKAKRHGWALALPAQEPAAAPAPAPGRARPRSGTLALPARSRSPTASITTSTGNRVTTYMTQGFVLSSSPDEPRLSSRALPMPDNSPIVRPMSDVYSRPERTGAEATSLGSSPSSLYSHSLSFYRAHDAPSALSLATIGTAGTAGTSDGTSGRGSVSGGLKAIFGSYNPPELGLGQRRGSKSRAQSPAGSHRSRRSEKSATGAVSGREEKEERRTLRKAKSSKSVKHSPSAELTSTPSVPDPEALHQTSSIEPASPEPKSHRTHSTKSPAATVVDPLSDGDTDSFFGIPLHSPRSSMARPKTAPNPARRGMDSPEKNKDDGRRPSASAIVQALPETPARMLHQHILPPDELARLMQPSPAPPEVDIMPSRRPSTANSVSGRRGSDAGSMRSTISANKSYFFPSPLPSPSDREFPPWSSTGSRTAYDSLQASALPSLPPPRRKARNPPSAINLSPLNTTSRPSSSSSASRLSAQMSAVSPSTSSTPSSLSGGRPNTSPRIGNSRHFFPQRRPPDYAVPPLPDPGIKAAIVAAQAKEERKKEDDDAPGDNSQPPKKKRVVKTGEKITRKPSFLNFDVEDDEDNEFIGKANENRRDRKEKKQDKACSPPKPKALVDVGRQQSFLDLDDIRQSFDSNRSDSDVS